VTITVTELELRVLRVLDAQRRGPGMTAPQLASEISEDDVQGVRSSLAELRRYGLVQSYASLGHTACRFHITGSGETALTDNIYARVVEVAA
jgi:chromosome condensin MukBEF MukE localization factor